MENLKELSNIGIILWAGVMVVYLISLLITHYYSKRSISSQKKLILEKFIYQNKIIISIVRISIVLFSMSILIGMHFGEFIKICRAMILLIGIILPGYFLILIGLKLEKRNLARKVVDSGPEKETKE